MFVIEGQCLVNALRHVSRYMRYCFLKVRDHGFFPTFQVLSKKKRIELCCFHRNRLTSSTAFHRKSLKSLPLSYKKKKNKTLGHQKAQNRCQNFQNEIFFDKRVCKQRKQSWRIL
uniref:Uncharacterized protein n=1 Tax=Cacopsylla melanoneura TaxID=428564 RepID=A0A8D9AEZ6_9HEMI